MDSEQEIKSVTSQTSQKLQSENDRLVYQIKKLEEENYSKTLQLASQRQIIESLQDRINESKSKPNSLSIDQKDTQNLQSQIKDLTSRCGILEQINEETARKAKKEVDIWQNEAEAARKTMRKLEEDLYQSKKIISEKEEFEEKYKKEVSEKEKLLISLENAKRAQQDLQKTADSRNQEILKLAEIIKTDNSSNEVKNLLQEITNLESKIQVLTEDSKKSSESLLALKLETKEILKKKTVLEEDSRLKSNKIFTLEQDLKKAETKIRDLQSQIESIQKSCLLAAEQHMINLKLEIKVQEASENQLENKQIEDLTQKSEILADENKKLIFQIESFEETMKSSIEDAISMYKARFKEFENQIELIQNTYNQQSTELSGSTAELKIKKKIIEEKESELLKMNKELESTKKKLNFLQEDCANFNFLISQINLEKSGLESVSKQKDSKLKNLASKIQFLEIQLQEKNKEILNKENELISVDRQVEILKKQINSRSSKIKQIATEQIDSQKKKIEACESEIKMLKEMLKSVQSELKYKQQEIQKIKKPSPRKVFDDSPLQAVKSKFEPENKLPADIKESPFKKQSLSIFKAKSPFKVNSKKGLMQDDTLAVLRHIIKGYLTSYVLCEKEKKEMVKVFAELDLGRRGVLDKNLVVGKCEELMFDTSLLGIYGKNIDYKDFVEINYHNQMQQIHRDLDINFSQILPGSISLSELKIVKQALRPLHKQIWDVIVERIEAEYPKEVDLMAVKQVLSQAQICL